MGLLKEEPEQLHHKWQETLQVVILRKINIFKKLQICNPSTFWVSGRTENLWDWSQVGQYSSFILKKKKKQGLCLLSLGIPKILLPQSLECGITGTGHHILQKHLLIFMYCACECRGQSFLLLWGFQGFMNQGWSSVLTSEHLASPPNTVLKLYLFISFFGQHPKS